MWDAMRQKEKGLEKVQILIDPTNGQNFLESQERTHLSRNDHTPLADAIMTGNVEIVKKLLQPIRKDSVLEAVKYGQLEIFKILLQHSQGKTKGLKRTFFL